MVFTVIWRRVLLDELAGFYVSALESGQEAAAITVAVAEIDRLLRTHPEGCGESRGQYERILILPPLSVDFEIHQEERVVNVLRLRYRPHPRPRN